LQGILAGTLPLLKGANHALKIRRNRQITEISLWLMFDCLVDGISVLEFGAEPAFNGTDNMASVEPTKDWRLKIHFDLKPGNSE
jgi:hypothetical protein